MARLINKSMLMPLLLVVYNAWNSLSASLGWKLGPASVPLGPDQQLPRTILDLSHSPLGISQQVEDDLLELDSIASDTRKIAGELGAENHPVFLKFARQQTSWPTTRYNNESVVSFKASTDTFVQWLRFTTVD